MIYHFSLRAVSLVVGIVLVLIGSPGLIQPGAGRRFAVRLPRSLLAGVIVLTIDLIWSFWLLSTMEMGEFASFRRPLLVALPVGYLLVLRFLDEFLAVRALGILCLLAAEPMLDAAFFRYEPSRLLVTVFAYLLVVAGLFWVTMPYLLRDQIDWSVRSDKRFRFLHGIAVGYGAIILALALTKF
jgi:hypothetical protein